MVPRFLALFLVVLPAAADGRATWVEARDALTSAYFDQLDPDQRDTWFTALASWDHPEIVSAFGEIASRYGAYLDQVESKIAERQGKLDPLKRRRALSEQEIALRDHHTKALEKLEAEFRRARASETLLLKSLTGCQEPKTVQAALSALDHHPSSYVRQLLARACAQWHAALADEKVSSKALASLKKLQKDADPAVRVATARALGAFRRAEAFALLAASAKDEDWRVRAAVVQVLTETRSSEGVSLLIEMMAKAEGRLKDDINTALMSLTGQNMGFADTWARWWASVGRQLPREPAKGSEMDPSERAKGTPQFYGIPTQSERLCFIIDISGSMNAEVEQLVKGPITGKKESEMPVEGKTRMEVAKNELKRCVGNLTQEKIFSVIFFNQAVRTWHPDPEKATPTVKDELRSDVDSVLASGTTYTLGALREAFMLAGVPEAGATEKPKDGLRIDTIYLLSDGGPTDNRMDDAQPMDPEIILEAVRQWNRDAGIVIHTIAVDTEPVGTYFLKTLAAQNGGKFVERRK
ncbi:MAG TPA: HEAT repeat domain-containing protein [Planctomycetota bacterium]|nr:HEAT repeat domain-containing protein [Planctomycetota bacterium]